MPPSPDAAPGVLSPAAAATGVTRSAAGHAFRVVGAVDVVAAADDVFVTFPAVVDGGEGGAGREGGVLVFQVEAVDNGFLVKARPGGPVGDDEDRGQTMADAAGALDYIQWCLNQTVINGLTPTQTGLHAGCVERDGLLLLLPAKSGAGKSTTVAGLLRSGWHYLTDEAALLDNDTLEVAPYPKPVTLDHGSWPVFPQSQDWLRSAESCLVPAPRLQGEDAVGPSIGASGQIAVVVAPGYAEGAETRLEPLTPGELLMLLAQSTFAFNEDGGRHLRCLAEVARRSIGYRLVIGDLDVAVRMLDRLVDGLPA